MRWLGLFTKKTFRKHLNLIFLRMDFIICIVSLTIFHPHFSSAFDHPHFIIRILSSPFFHPHFIICIFLSAIRHPPSAAIRSALYRGVKKRDTRLLIGRIAFLTSGKIDTRHLIGLHRFANKNLLCDFSVCKSQYVYNNIREYMETILINYGVLCQINIL